MAKCPICKTTVKKGNKFFPFCSDRCKVTDLGSWAAERYRVPSENPITEEQLEEELEQRRPRKDWEH